MRHSSPLLALRLQRRLVDERKQGVACDQFLLVEHPHTITMGRNGRMEHLLAEEDVLRRAGISFHETDRGGDVTYHGPGQVVGYPILDLSPDRRDVHRYVRDLEEVMIRVCADYGVTARRIPGLTGAWVSDLKIGAIGVRIARWVTSHGFALNVTNDLSPFGLIVPCGIRERGVTSLALEAGRALEVEEVPDGVARRFAEVFGVTET